METPLEQAAEVAVARSMLPEGAWEEGTEADMSFEQMAVLRPELLTMFTRHKVGGVVPLSRLDLTRLGWILIFSDVGVWLVGFIRFDWLDLGWVV